MRLSVEGRRRGEETPPRTATWGHSEPVDRYASELISLAVWTEARSGLGEDAEPTLLYHRPSGQGLLGVYDGLGGAGARPVGQSRDGRTLTNAYVAARLAHLTVQDWFVHEIGGPRSADQLRSRLAACFGDARRDRGKLVGTLRRDLPTTLALLDYRPVDERRIALTAWWAGDSRCYVLDGRHGLQQLSRDDTDIDDALQTLVADQPMTNLVSASGEFHIRRRAAEVTLPCLLVCATDGFFNYVDSPALFEYQLLDCLLAARRDPDRPAGEWAGLLAERVLSYTADDATLALVGLGYPDFASLRGAFADRWRLLYHEHFLRLKELGADPERAAFVRAREESWLSYRDGYSRYLDEDSAHATHGPREVTREAR